MPQNGRDSQTSSTASGKNSLAKSLNTTSPMQNNMKTSTISTQLSIMDELTSLAEDSPVNRSASQENAKAQRMSATCGRRCLELSENVNPVGSWARTFAGLLVGRTDWFSKRVALTWKLLGTPSNRLLFQLVPQAMRHTDATEFGLLLTPTTSERSEHPEEMRARAEAKGYKNGTKYNSLMSQILYGNMLPTPNAFDWNTPRSPEAWKKRERETRLDVAKPIKTNGKRGNATNTNSTTRKGERINRQGKGESFRRSSDTIQIRWENFPTVPPVCGGDDGLPKELDGITFPKWRRESIKAYGNAIVPQVAYRIFQTIQDYEP